MKLNTRARLVLCTALALAATALLVTAVASARPTHGRYSRSNT